MKCPNCGYAQLSEGATVCPKCNQTLVRPSSLETRDQSGGINNTGQIEADNLSGRDMFNVQGNAVFNIAPEPRSHSALTLRITPPILPLTLTPLVGRDDDILRVLALLRQSRLVTITGIGGIGKTALAQNVTKRIWEEERGSDKPRGVYFIPLDALTSGRELGPYIQRRLLPSAPPIREGDENELQADAVQTLTSAIEDRARLFVLDNFESVLDEQYGNVAITFVRELLAATRDEVHFLITSRRAMNLARLESEYSLKSLEAKYAIKLFYDLACDSVGENDEPLVAEICQLEDYLPLGIELAAAAVGQASRPLAEMLEALRKTPLDVEIADTLNFPKRQQGLEATFRYTFDHLSTEAQRLFCISSVFKNSMDRQVLRELDGTPEWEKAAAELVNWKLLALHTTPNAWRYAMLKTIHAFSVLQMTRVGKELGLDLAQLRKRHALYYLGQAAEQWKTRQENRVTIEDLAPDIDNYQAAASWIKDVGQQSIHEPSFYRTLLSLALGQALDDQLPGDATAQLLDAARKVIADEDRERLGKAVRGLISDDAAKQLGDVVTKLVSDDTKEQVGKLVGWLASKAKKT